MECSHSAGVFNAKPHLSIVAIGPCDGGKSSVLGHLALKAGLLDQETRRNLEREASMVKITKVLLIPTPLSFPSHRKLCRHFQIYPWITDKLREERIRGITIDVSFLKLTSANFDLTLIDVPGHRSKVKNMITGIAQADVALLILSARTDEFDKTNRWATDYFTTLQIATIARAMGIKQMIVGVNQMDSYDFEPRYPRQRFEGIKKELIKCLEKAGFNPDDIPFVPISAHGGDNLIQVSRHMGPEWHDGWTRRDASGSVTSSGFTLLQAFDSMRPIDRRSNAELPLRLAIRKVYTKSPFAIVVGRVETGVLKPGMEVTFAPDGTTSLVDSVEMHGVSVSEAGPGCNVGFRVNGSATSGLRRGMVCGESQNDPPIGVVAFEALIDVIDHPGKIRIGYTPVISCHTSHIACRFDALLKTVDRNTNEDIEIEPAFIQKGQRALVRMKPAKRVCVEEFEKYARLGRIVVRDMDYLVAVGQIERVEKASSDRKINTRKRKQALDAKDFRLP